MGFGEYFLKSEKVKTSHNQETQSSHTPKKYKGKGHIIICLLIEKKTSQTTNKNENPRGNRFEWSVVKHLPLRALTRF